jgi:hypothetical protein
MVSPHVEPMVFYRTADGAIVAEVRQSVRDVQGKPLQGQAHGLKDKTVGHVSVFERARWLASTSRMLKVHEAILNKRASAEADAPFVPRLDNSSRIGVKA